MTKSKDKISWKNIFIGVLVGVLIIYSGFLVWYHFSITKLIQESEERSMEINDSVREILERK